MNKRYLKALSLLLLSAMLMCSLPVCSFAAKNTKTTDRIFLDYDSNPVTSKWAADVPSGASFQSGCLMKTISSGAISGRSLAINKCDIRWWSLAYEDEEFEFSFDFYVSENYATEFLFCINTQDGETTTEALNGRFIQIKSSDKEAVIADAKGKKICSVEPKKKYHLTATAKRGSSEYTVKLGKDVAGTGTFRSEIYGIYGLRMNAQSRSSESYIVIDNFKVSTVGRVYPQEHSYQAKGIMPVVKLPGSQKPTSLTLFCNKTNTKTFPVMKNGEYYMQLKAVLDGCEIEYEKNGSAFAFMRGDEKITVFPGCELVISADGKEYEIKDMLFESSGKLMASASAINLLLGAKIFADTGGNVLMVTTDEYKDGKLRVIAGKLWMDGEPYYEISFNKFDLYYQISADKQFCGGRFPNNDYPNEKYTVSAAEKALKQLSENGFKTVRIFCGTINPGRNKAEKDNFYAAFDMMFDMLDKYGIKAVICMQLFSSNLFAGEYSGNFWVSSEDGYDLMTDANSGSRKVLHEFIKEFVTRYGDRDSVLMWEIGNEGNLQADIVEHLTAYSAIQLGDFYADCAAQIHKYDTERPVTSGDALIRPSQWHLLKGVLDGAQREIWTLDSAEERRQILQILNHGLDVISVHTYNTGYSESYTENGVTKTVTFDSVMAEADALGKPVYNGETGGIIGNANDGNTGKDTAKGRAKYLDTIIDAGIQLTHWWTFSSDRYTFNKDIDSFTVTPEDTPEFFEAVKKANEKLKAKYLKNAAEKSNIITAIEKYADVTECKKDSSCPLYGFGDISMDEWYHDGIHWCLENGIMKGVGSTSFDPFGNTSRGQLVTILYRLCGEPSVSGKCTFSDVGSGSYYENAVIWAAKNGIVNGYDDGTFKPDSPITREQFCAILYRYAGSAGKDTSKRTALSGFADSKKISGYAFDAMSWAVAEKLISGVGENTLDPSGKAVRAQAAVILQRFSKL